MIFTAVTLSVSLICYLRPLLTYGFTFFTFYDGMPPLRMALHHATLEVWGEMGFFAIIVALVWLLVRRPHMPIVLLRVDQALMIAIVLFLLAFVRLPLEAGYLIPVVPFLLAWLAIRLPHRGFTLVCIAMIISPFVLDLEAESSLTSEAMQPSIPISVSQSQMRLLPLGPLFTEQARQEAYAAKVGSLIFLLQDLPRPAVVLADGMFARLDVTLGEAGKGLVIVPSLDRLWEARPIDPLSLLWPPTDSMRNWPIYILPGVESPELDDPRLNGRRPLLINETINMCCSTQ